MKKILLLCFILLITILISGCADKNETALYFESYNQLENPPGENLGGDFTFEVNEQRFEVMDGYTAMHLEIIGDEEKRRYMVIMADSDRNEVLSIMTEQEYDVEAVRACIDTDGTVYILYSIWDTMIGNLFMEDLKSTYILEIDMENMEVKKQYDFGVQVIVLTVHNGYVYTMEDGRVYRKLLTETENKECMADLGFRGIPDVAKYGYMIFRTNVDGIEIRGGIPNTESIYGKKKNIMADIKYTDQPIGITK